MNNSAPQKPRTKKARPSDRTPNWFMTLNAEDATLEDLKSKFSDYRWAGQLEKGSETGYLHYQLTIANDSSKPIRFSTLKKKFPTIHLELTRDVPAAFDYCTKEDTRVDGPWKNGDWSKVLSKSKQGERNDLKELADMILNQGMTANQVAIADTRSARYMPYLRAVEEGSREANEEQFTEESRDVQVTWLYGKPGSGKTTKARQLAGKSAPRLRLSDSHPYDKYHGQKSIVIDEFSSNRIDFELFMDVIGDDPTELPARVYNRTACYTSVYVCSNLAPWDCFQNIEGHDDRIGGLYRRIGTLIHVSRDENGDRQYDDETDTLRDFEKPYL